MNDTDMGTIRGVITLVLTVAFVALIVWIASSRNKHRFDAVARMPLEDDGPEPLTPASSRKEKGSKE